MSEEVNEIVIEKEIPLFGEGDSLETRLRKVSLRGFPQVNIYHDANFELIHLTSEDVVQKLYTPQPTVYKTHLEKVNRLAKLFTEKGVDIFNLDKAYDYIATASDGIKTSWTMLPPIVEQWEIPRHPNGGFDYSNLIGETLSQSLRGQKLSINPKILEFPHTNQSGIFDLINDGSHRIHAGFEKAGIKVLRIKGMTPGYPYYAIPQPYSTVIIVPQRDEVAIDTKIHVIESPGHKQLYRLFPSGGIMSGNVRTLKVEEKAL